MDLLGKCAVAVAAAVAAAALLLLALKYIGPRLVDWLNDEEG